MIKFNRSTYLILIVLCSMLILMVSAASGEFDDLPEETTTTETETETKKERKRFNRFSILSVLFDRLGFTKMQKIYAIIGMIIFLGVMGVRPGRQRRWPNTPSTKKKDQSKKKLLILTRLPRMFT